MLEADSRNGIGQLPTTWQEFETAIKRRFVRSTEEEFARAKINSMKQTGTVKGYCEAFTKTALKCRSMDERTKMDLFINGLKPETRDFVFKEDPADLKEAERLAERFDNRRFQQRQFQKDDRSYNKSRNNGHQNDPMEVDHSRMNSASGSGKSRGRGRGRGQQNGGTRSVRKCYACGEPGHIARDCKKQGKSHKKQPKVNAAHGTESASSSESEN
jgi:hypothetical protein